MVPWLPKHTFLMCILIVRVDTIFLKEKIDIVVLKAKSDLWVVWGEKPNCVAHLFTVWIDSFKKIVVTVENICWDVFIFSWNFAWGYCFNVLMYSD